MRSPPRVLYVSEVQWRAQVSRKHLIVRRFPEDWDVLFASPANASPGENSLKTRRDELYPNVRYVSLPLPKPESGIPFVRALIIGDRALFGRISMPI